MERPATGWWTRREALALLGSAAVLPACASLPGAPAFDGQARAAALLDRIAENLLVLGPEGATALGIDTGARAPLRYRLSDRSAAGQQRIADQLRADLALVRALDGGLGDAPPDHATRTSIEVVKSAYATALSGFALPYGDVAVGGWRNTPYVVIQNVGAYLDVPRFLDSDHRIVNAADAQAYLERLDSFADQLAGELGRMRDGAARGAIAPGFLIDKALGQLARSASGARNGGALVSSIVRRTRNIPGDWERRATAIARTRVAPALELQIAELERQRALASDSAGMWARPNGEEYYAWALRAATTTAMTPEEVHAVGLAELAMLHRQMDPILKSLGYSIGSVGERMTALGKDQRFLFADDDSGRAEIMAYLHRQVALIRGLMPRAFETLAPARLEIRRLPPEEEPGAPAAYGGSGSIDGSIPGKFWINLRTTALHSRYSLPTLAHHEAIPGHVWQGEYSNRLPLIRTLLAFSAYSEGWALYGQQLADELGVYDGDPVGRLGYLQSIAFRACRLVVDTGLHARRWTRAQAIDWFATTNGSGREEVAGEVDRYCSWPGQACGYKVGHGEINRQRQRAKAALGARFDVRAFNDTLVKGGNVPLDVLARNVAQYIAGRGTNR